jgi:hypothetical protein
MKVHLCGTKYPYQCVLWGNLLRVYELEKYEFPCGDPKERQNEKSLTSETQNLSCVCKTKRRNDNKTTR